MGQFVEYSLIHTNTRQANEVVFQLGVRAEDVVQTLRQHNKGYVQGTELEPGLRRYRQADHEGLVSINIRAGKDSADVSILTPPGSTRSIYVDPSGTISESPFKQTDGVIDQYLPFIFVHRVNGQLVAQRWIEYHPTSAQPQDRVDSVERVYPPRRGPLVH